MVNANRPSTLPDVPGIDDCDYLLSATTRDEKDSLYLRITEFEFDGRDWFAGAVTIDQDSNHSCQDLDTELCFGSLAEAARYLQNQAQELLGVGKFCYDTNTRRYLRRKGH